MTSALQVGQGTESVVTLISNTRCVKFVGIIPFLHAEEHWVHMPLFDCYRSFFSTVKAGSLILTPNQRLSRFVTDQYYLYLQLHHADGVDSFACAPLQGWVTQLYQQCASDRSPISDVQSQLLWESTLNESGVFDSINEGIVSAYLSAHNRVEQWCLDQEVLDCDQVFLGLQQAFYKKCDLLNLMTQKGVYDCVVNAISSGRVTPPKRVIFLGFDDIVPAVKLLIESLKLQSVGVEFINLESHSQTYRVELASEKDEFEQACQFAKAKLLAQPELTVGIVVPNLAAHRVAVTNTLNKVFDPEYNLPSIGQHAPGYNLSAGQPLAQTPIVNCALRLLQLNPHQLDVETIVQLLESPFLAVIYQQSWVMRLIVLLREGPRAVNFRHFLSMILACKDEHDEGPIRQCYDQFSLFFKQLSNAQSLSCSRSQWLEIIVQTLHVLGFGVGRDLDTLEFQQYKAWQEALKNFELLDHSFEPCKYTRAISDLSKLCFVPFVPKTENSPIQVLGVLEASGMHFDYLWVMGLTDDVWPEPIQPNPVLSVALQRKQKMPRASVERELDIAKKLTDRFTHSAREVVFSHATWRGDEPLRPSRLIQSYPITKMNSVNRSVHHQAVKLEGVDDTFGGPIQVSKQAFPGGSSVLKEQAACPFRAYATFRLQAQNPEVLEDGLSPMVRGICLHKALELIWSTLETQEALLQLDETALSRLIEESVESAWVQSHTQHLGKQLKALEVKRSYNLIFNWLEQEKQRPSFKVASQERLQEGQVGPLKIRLRLDRVDELADGSFAVVDYKTGKTNPSAWQGARPDEPQIPLYSVLTEHVSASAFVELSSHDVAAKGLAQDDALWPALKSIEAAAKKSSDFNSWNELLNYWQGVLSNLAQEFVSGYAAVAPKAGSTTCRYCNLHSICRIGLATVEASNNDD